MTKDKTVETPEVLPAKRGVGRPLKILELMPKRTMPERIQTIKEYHGQALQMLAQGAMYAVMCGLELHMAKTQVPHGKWGEWVENECPFSCRTAERYMEAAEGTLQRISNPTVLSDLTSLLGRELSPNQRTMLLGEVKKSVGGETMWQLYLDLGIVKGEARIETGGRAILIKWLAEHFPKCKAREEAALPPEIREKWSEYLGQLAVEAQANINDINRQKWGKIVGKLVMAMKKKLYANMPRPTIEHYVGLFGDMRAELIAAIRER